MSLLCARNLYFAYGRRTILSDISLVIQAGQVVCLLGPNGSGKATLLKLLMGLFTPHQGVVFLENKNLIRIPARQLARRMAYVPQVHRLAFAYRVLDVVLMGRLPHKSFFFTHSRADLAAAETALEKLGISHLKKRPYTAVSGGERQLILIVRALAQGADIFIMDEPVSGLDYGNQLKLLNQIEVLARMGYTFIKTTHFPDHALWIADRVVMLQSGRIIADGPTVSVVTEDYLRRLYGLPIEIACMENGLRLCMPGHLSTSKSGRTRARA